MQWNSLWYLTSASICAWTLLTLLASRQGDRSANRMMALFLLALLVPCLDAFGHSQSIQVPFWLAIFRQYLTLVFGPALYWLVRRILLKPQWQPIILLHFLPFGIATMYSHFGGYIPVQLYLQALLCHVAIYTTASCWLLIQNRNRLTRLIGEFRFSSYYWLLFLSAVWFLLMVLDLSIWLKMLNRGWVDQQLINIISTSFAVAANLVSLASLYLPSLFFNVPNVAKSTDIEAPAKQLSTDAANELEAQLARVMNRQQPHLNEEVSLATLAETLGISSHQLSELLNGHLGTNFYDYLNHWRFEHAVALLVHPNKNLAVTDIAYQSGFNNRTSFYKVFKQKTGTTPTQYKRQLTTKTT